jgi:cobalt/nickel transport system ATP-binding protein
MDQPLIEMTGIRFAYNHDKPVLNDLDFTFHDNQRVALRGPNGSGKTTLFHLIMGLIKPQAGTINVLGQPRREEPDFFEVRRAIGFVFQDADDQLFCPTVAEDVAFGPLNLGVGHDEARRIVKETLEKLELSHLADRITYKLSGGEKKLVSLATVLAMSPQMLLLDEPTTGLDEETVDRIVEVLTTSDLPYLIISHDSDFLSRVVNESLFMQDGRIVRG